MVLSMDRWVGKVAIVTGASAGIGAAIAEQLVIAGVKVVGLARRKERVEELSKKLANAKGKLYSLKCDVSKEEDILNAFKWIDENVGHVHILINNAGIIQDTNLIEGDTALWKKLFDVNVWGLSIGTREAIKIMRKHDIAGHIININSVAGHKFIYVPQLNVYSASKHAVTNLTKTFARELQANNINNIKLTSISPGGVETDILTDNLTPASINEITNAVRGAGLLESEDVADSVIYALSTGPGVQSQIRNESIHYTRQTHQIPLPIPSSTLIKHSVDELIIQPLHEVI